MPLSTAELHRLADENQLIAVRNVINSTVVHVDTAMKTTVYWAPVGNSDGEDVQEVSAALLRDRDFRNFLAKEILVIEDAPEELTRALDQQKLAWQRRQQQVAEAGAIATAAADRTVGKGVACIAPRGARGELCGSYALVMGRNINERPPLCGEHSHLAGQYAITELDTIGEDGKPEVVWRRASLIKARG